MDYQNDFETWQERIEALPATEVKYPNQPIDEVAASAEILGVEATIDRDALLGAGAIADYITDLPSLSGALRYCQAQWMSEYLARKDAKKEWQEKSPTAYDLRDELLHHFKFAYRNNSDILTKVMRINKGNGQLDMIQDLIELAVLGEKYPDPLTAIGFDISRFSSIKTLAHSLSELLAAANGSSNESSNIKLQRDKAYTLLAIRMSSIREYGRYVFWKDESRKEKYYNNYMG